MPSRSCPRRRGRRHLPDGTAQGARLDNAATAGVEEVPATVGIDTHVDVHVTVASDRFGRHSTC